MQLDASIPDGVTYAATEFHGSVTWPKRRPRNGSESLADLAAEICPNDPLDLGIARAVKILRDARVHTYESCEGGEGHAYGRPTVRFHGDRAEGWRALAICKTYGLPVLGLARVWDVNDDEPTGPYWQIEFRRRID